MRAKKAVFFIGKHCTFTYEQLRLEIMSLYGTEQVLLRQLQLFT